MANNIAFIGSVGVPNNYGGFEMFLEACAPALTKNFNKVFITCDSSRYSDQSRQWLGVERLFVPVRANGASSVLHDLLAFLAVVWRVKAIVVLGVSGGVFFPLFRLLCAVFGVKLIVNVDGVEWRRGKFSRVRRWFLYISDRLAQKCADRVVVDNEGLRAFLAPSVRKHAALIAYPGDHVIRNRQIVKPTLAPNCLTICRIEPENNCHVLIEAFEKAGCGTYVFIGNWDSSEYGRTLRVRYKDVPGLEMRDPVYDRVVLGKLREECNVYLHGHSVGGTNPSLVEMLFYDCEIFAFECEFNRYTAEDVAEYFSSVEHLAEIIIAADFSRHIDRSAARQRYSRERICTAYTQLILELIPRHVEGSAEHPVSLPKDFLDMVDEEPQTRSVSK